MNELTDIDLETLDCNHTPLFDFEDNAIEYFTCSKCNAKFYKFKTHTQSTLRDFF
jgi:hypothetical protein